MDFTLNDDQRALASLAQQVLRDHGGHERARAIEQAHGFDRDAWLALGSTGLLDAVAGGDSGIVGAAQLARISGQEAVTVPAYALLTALVLLGETGVDLGGRRQASVVAGEEVVTLALHEPGLPTVRWSHTCADGDRLTGMKPAVPVLSDASAAFVSAQSADGPGLYLVELDAPGVERRLVRTTDRGAAGNLVLTDAPADRVGDAITVARGEHIAAVLAGATVLGLGREATARAAVYISEREQFGRTIASFQSPVLRLADSHMDLEAMEVTLLQAAWQLDRGRDAAMAVSVAKWWSALGGHRVLHTAQHLHGGIGADIEFPAHRYFLRGKQLLDTVGGAAVHASRLGAAIAIGASR